MPSKPKPKEKPKDKPKPPQAQKKGDQLLGLYGVWKGLTGDDAEVFRVDEVYTGGGSMSGAYVAQFLDRDGQPTHLALMDESVFFWTTNPEGEPTEGIRLFVDENDAQSEAQGPMTGPDEDAPSEDPEEDIGPDED